MKNANDYDHLNSTKVEASIENWLDGHRDWFVSYALEKLDRFTIEKWLSTKGLKICQCNEETSDKCLYPKRNSIPTSLLVNCSIVNQKKDFSKLYKKNSICSAIRAPLKENCPNRRFSNVITKTEHFSRSTSSSCLLRNRKVLPNNETCNQHNEKTTQSNTDKKIKKNHDENQKPSRDASPNNLNFLASNYLPKGKDIFQRNTSPYSFDSTTTSNLLKLLIKSKIKLPSCFYKISDTEKLKIRREKNNDFEFLLDIIKDTLNDFDLNSLKERISNNVKILVSCEKSYLYFINKNRESPVSISSNSFISNQTKERNKVFKDNIAHNNKEDFQTYSSLIEYVAQCGNHVNVPDINQVRFQLIFYFVFIYFNLLRIPVLCTKMELKSDPYSVCLSKMQILK